MNISSLHSAKGLKFKLRAINGIAQSLADGAIVIIENTSDSNDFFVMTRNGDKEIFCAEKNIAKHINNLLGLEKIDAQGNIAQKNIFVIEGRHDNYIEIQSYAFASMTEYKTEISIQVSEIVFEKNSAEKLRNIFVCDSIGLPAVFALRYKNNKKADIRFIGENMFLNIKNTPYGLIADKIDFRRDRTDRLIDVYLAPKIEFTKDAGNVGELAKDIDKIGNAQTYLSRWDAYNELVKKEIESRCEEFGKIGYTDYKRETIEGGLKFTFSIKDKIEKSYLGTSLGVKDASVDRNGKNIDVRVGEIVSISDDKIVTELDREDMVDSIPQNGYLVLSPVGDWTIIERRKRAKDRMIYHKSPIKNIVALIEVGASEFASDINWTDNKAITSELEKNFKQAKKLNSQQKEALRLAINTPDIALIQGPPGTGKTTVIKAICERFREVFERDNNGARPKILISSFQNDAVENAVSDPHPGELPPYRKGKKREEQFKRSIEKWVSEVKDELTKLAGNNEHLEFGKIRSRLSDEYFYYKSTGEKPEAGIKLIKEYLGIPEIKYPNSLEESVKKIFADYDKKSDSDIPNDDPVVGLLKEQRLTKDSFNDDGEKMVKKLRSRIRIRSELNIEKTYLDAINAVADNGISDENMFGKYIEAIKALKKIYIPETGQSYPKNINQIDECLQELALAFYNNRLSTTDNLEDKKSLIIGEFLDRFEDEAEMLIGKYSLTTAATCQQSLSLASHGDDSYDLVIVDEAARATPLDLFIPMSMGRKIILVGDHKQLPHMLEPEVLKLIRDDPKYGDLNLDISLFEKLFSMFESGIQPKSILLDTQYRMHPDICQFVSEAFYEGKLKSGITAEDRVIPHKIFDGKALAYINVTKKHDTENGGQSKSRVSEARLIAKDVEKVAKICPDKTIGVITFYSAQKDMLESEIGTVLNYSQLDKVEIGTVDSFQGKEFDFVFLSCVRSNTRKEEKDSVGFLTKPNRVCVSLSRAKYQLAVYADAETVNTVECFKLLHEKCAIKKEGYYYEY
jgi:hypothetical protein